MDEQKYEPVRTEEPVALTEGRRGRISAALSLVALVLALLCAASLADGMVNAYVNRVDNQVALRVADGDGISAPSGASPETEITISPAADELTPQQIYQKVRPSVVSIAAQQYDATVTGTGMILSEDGYLLTNYHVIAGAESVSVLLEDNQELEADIVGTDEVTDLAVLRIARTGLTPVEFGDSASVQVGDVVYAIGDPLGIELRGTMTDGRVAAVNRNVKLNGSTITLIQTTAALNEGNSGGPLINDAGQVVGINTLKMSGTAGVEEIGFAIPTSVFRPIVNEILDKGYVSGRPSLGLEVASLSLAAQVYYRLPNGLYVTDVSENSDAAAQGIGRGDILIAVDGESVSSTEELELAVANHAVGDVVTLSIFRSGWVYTVKVTLIDAADA